jgi:hypothetical protein
MPNDHSDDDVIVISEDEARYETPEEHAAADPADGDELAANDEATSTVPSEAGRYGSMTSPEEAAASGTVAYGTVVSDSDLSDSDLSDSDLSDTDASDLDASGIDADADPDTHPVTEPVTLASSDDTSAEAPGYLGTTAADRADAAAADTPANGASVDTVNGNGPAIPMPGSSATSASSAAQEASATPVASGGSAVGDAAPDSSWPQIQSLFVDDPHAAVQQAADVAGGALAALVAAANNREQTLRDSWQGDAIGTEDLRTALRDYRDLAGRLSTVAKDL